MNRFPTIGNWAGLDHADDIQIHFLHPDSTQACSFAHTSGAGELWEIISISIQVIFGGIHIPVEGRDGVEAAASRECEAPQPLCFFSHSRGSHQHQPRFLPATIARLAHYWVDRWGSHHSANSWPHWPSLEWVMAGTGCLAPSVIEPQVLRGVPLAGCYHSHS